MLQRSDSKLKRKIVALLRKQHRFHVPPPAEIFQYKAYRGFFALGPGASNAVPQLVEIFHHNLSAFCQTTVPTILAQIGPAAAPAIPALLRGVTHTNWLVRGNCICALRQIHAEPKFMVPVSVKSLSDPDAYVRAHAVRALGACGKDAESAVPALIELWRKEPPAPGGHKLSVEGGVFSPFWITSITSTPIGPIGRFNVDVPELTRRALKSIDPEAAAKAGIQTDLDFAEPFNESPQHPQ